MEKLWIRSIFNSIDGEVNRFGQGRFSTFIRCAGCNYSCVYCDTKYAQGLDKAKEMTIDEILSEVISIDCEKVTITGGEPLLQQPVINRLITKLFLSGFKISVETNGSFTIPSDVKDVVHSWVVDLKLPSSGMYEKTTPDICFDLQKHDFIKFVVGDKGDYDLAKMLMNELSVHGCNATIAMSPLMGYGGPDPQQLLKWIQEDGLFDVVFNAQIHKLLKLQEEDYF